MRGLAHIGALEVLQERGLLKAVKEYIGISAGSFCAFAVCIGCTLAELRTVSALLDFSLMQSVTPETAFKFLETFGFDSGENMDKLLNVLLRSKGLSPSLTFRELRDTPAPSLRIFATDLNTCMPKEFSAELTPDVQIVQALRASMSIPIYFTPVQGGDGHLLVDGGVISHVPLFLIRREERETTLSINFRSDHIFCESIPTLSAYISQLYASIHRYNDVKFEREWGHRIVNLPCGEFPSTHFQATTDEKMALMDSGRRGMEDFLKSVVGRRTPRRFSVA
jgi:NTE family protein